MNETDKKKIIDRYNQRINQIGATFEALASGTEERRNTRFNVLKQVGIETGDSVLDLGCGFGDFYDYLLKRGINTNYTGIDINPLLIEHASKKYPNSNFKVLDIQKEDPGSFDYVVSTSCFNLKLTGFSNYEFIEDIFNKCYKFAKKGVAIDFMTSYVDFKGNANEAFYYEPEKLFKIAKSITKRVSLRHDYPLFEFCIYLYPDFQGWHK